MCVCVTRLCECVLPVRSGGGWTVGGIEDLCVVERAVGSWGRRRVQDLQTENICLLSNCGEKTANSVCADCVCVCVCVPEGRRLPW